VSRHIVSPRKFTVSWKTSNFPFQTVKIFVFKLSQFSFSNCQNFPFQTVKIFVFKLSQFSFSNCQNFPFQTVKNFPFQNCQNFPFQTVKIFLSKTVKISIPNCQNFPFSNCQTITNHTNIDDPRETGCLKIFHFSIFQFSSQGFPLQFYRIIFIVTTIKKKTKQKKKFSILASPTMKINNEYVKEKKKINICLMVLPIFCWSVILDAGIMMEFLKRILIDLREEINWRNVRLFEFLEWIFKGLSGLLKAYKLFKKMRPIQITSKTPSLTLKFSQNIFPSILIRNKHFFFA
jgi:hypothetical protein